MSEATSFEDLEQLRRFLREIRSSQIESMEMYFSERDAGFCHKLDQPKFSRASTATCVLSLKATGRWSDGPWNKSGGHLIREMMLKDFNSAELGPDNPFTTAFALETYSALAADYHFNGATQKRLSERAQYAESKLIEALEGGPATKDDNPRPPKGAAALQSYPPSAYLTQLVVRVLLQRRKLSIRLQRNVRKWAFDELNRQIGLRIAKDKAADVFALIYSPSY